MVVRSIRKDDLHADYVPGGPFHQPGRAHGAAGRARLDSGHRLHPRLTDGYFAFKDLGQTQIKGVEEPLHVYEVLGAGPLRTRCKSRPAGG